MTDHDRCPMCLAGEVVRSEGRLDQSGHTYLPTTMFSCAICGFARYEPALATQWRPVDAPAEPEAPAILVRRAA